MIKTSAFSKKLSKNCAFAVEVQNKTKMYTVLFLCHIIFQNQMLQVFDYIHK